MANVYAWPPVAVVTKFWNLDSPLSKSYSMTSGRRYASGIMSPRRRAQVVVHGRRNYGLGYMAALERLLQGGLHFVRLSSCRMTFGMTAPFGPDGNGGSFFSWRDTSSVGTQFKHLTQEAGDEFTWFEGLYINATIGSGSGGRSLTISGDLPRNGIIAIPGEFITIFTAQNPGGETHMVTNVVRSSNQANAPRTATIKLATPASGPGRIDLNTSETGIFELISEFPELGRSGDSIPDIQLDFREVLLGEISEGIVEVNPWT